VVDDFKYLGSHMVSSEKDFKCRKGQAWGAFWKLENIWKSKTTSLKLKIRIFKASCLSILLYGSETWILTQKLRNELDSFATNCYRYILGIKRLDKVPNKSIYQQVQQIPLTITADRRQLTWTGHILRSDADEPVRIYSLYEPSEQMGKARLGAHKTTFHKHIASLINDDMQLSAKEIVTMAMSERHL